MPEGTAARARGDGSSGEEEERGRPVATAMRATRRRGIGGLWVRAEERMEGEEGDRVRSRGLGVVLIRRWETTGRRGMAATAPSVAMAPVDYCHDPLV